MALIDTLIDAKTTEERRKVLQAWEHAFGDIFELVDNKRLSLILSRELPPERYADLLRAYVLSRRRFLESVSERLWNVLDGPEFQYHMILYVIAQNLEGDIATARVVIEEMLLSN